MEATRTATLRPNAIKVLAGLGMAWNLFGVVQFSGQVLSTPAMLMDKGMTPAQAALYAGLPVWMTIAFAIGVFGGLAGSTLLLVGRRGATATLAVSLAGYVLLFLGDITEGVFAAFGPSQVAILTTVVVIAIGILGLSIRVDRC